MKTFLIILAALAALAGASWITGGHNAVAAGGASDPPHNRMVTIQFRRDALGAAAALPVGPLTSNINGAETSVSGRLVRAADEWVVIDRGTKEIWVPKSVILLIKYD